MMPKISFWYIFMGILTITFFFNFYINWREFKRLQYGTIPKEFGTKIINEKLYKEISLRESEEFNGHFWTSFFRFTSLVVIVGFELVPRTWMWLEAFVEAKSPGRNYTKVFCVFARLFLIFLAHSFLCILSGIWSYLLCSAAS